MKDINKILNDLDEWARDANLTGDLYEQFDDAHCVLYNINIKVKDEEMKKLLEKGK